MLFRAEEFVPGIAPPEPGTGPALWFAFAGDRLLVVERGAGAAVPESTEPLGGEPADGRRLYLGRLRRHDCFALELPEGTEPGAGLVLEGLRALHGRLSDELFAIAGRAFQIVEWDRTHRFCGRCGEPTERQSEERARRCPGCGLQSFPRLSPAVITLVERGREILLARGRYFPMPWYSTLAGFVEPGESLEEAVAREIKEEVGIDVAEIRYFGSQPWPFPHSLMIGFTARYAGGELRIDESEIADAGWFSPERLPLLPPGLSIARVLIDSALARLRRSP